MNEWRSERMTFVHNILVSGPEGGGVIGVLNLTFKKITCINVNQNYQNIGIWHSKFTRVTWGTTLRNFVIIFVLDKVSKPGITTR